MNRFNGPLSFTSSAGLVCARARGKIVPTGSPSLAARGKESPSGIVVVEFMGDG